VLKIELRGGNEAYVSNYVEPGVNVANEVADPFDADAGTGFDDPDNLVLHPNGDLYITEDDEPGDIWVARGSGEMATEVVVFARLLDCEAEPTGIYFDAKGGTLWVNSQHAGLNGGDDLSIEITQNRHPSNDDED
jgi:secreted PhoX family phosphatase